ncbi:Gfo/Idh/MocA family protein [Flavimarina sp. Hel_I_48]|uniref:Gfo/Idh/MocA family protein n=1 Tax=Flavimarina sp. Hel_I_48 TaxID=1392488 RepID=UPI0004DF0551|nr:Gfo/Idh/MocA family oxidoreductase [Flavimarina sp. Hel_I_48]
MAEKDKIIWGILGCGDVAEVKSGPAFQKCSNSELRAVMRRNAAKAEDFAKRHKVPIWYDDADDLLNNKEINAVYIATPPSSHLKYTLKAIEAGKDIYLEKPMTRTAAEANEILTALNKSKVKLVVAHYRRKLAAFEKVKQLLENNAIGTVRFAKIEILQPLKSDLIAQTDDNWRVEPDVSGGVYFYDIAPHELDLMADFFGPIKKIHGFAVNQAADYKAPDIVNGVISFENGVQFQGMWCFNASEKDKKDQCIIYGSEGTITFAFYGKEVSLDGIQGKEIFSFEQEEHVQQPLIQATVDYFMGKSENPCPPEAGLTVMRMLEGLSN